MTSTETPTREKTVTWEDPMATALAGRGAVGLDFLRSMIAGDVAGPPIASLLGMSLVSVYPGEAVFTLTPDESMFNPIGVVHGGIVCTLLDSALGCALHTTLPAGKGYTSVEIKVSYLKAVLPSVRPARPRPGASYEPARASASPRARYVTPPVPSSPPPPRPCWSSTSEVRSGIPGRPGIPHASWGLQPPQSGGNAHEPAGAANSG